MDNPCNEDWNNMRLMDESRFCEHCQKKVIDFTGYTEVQILDHFIKNPRPVCGRISNFQKDLNFDLKSTKNLRLNPIAATLLTLTTLTVNAENKLEILKPPFQVDAFKKSLQPQPIIDSILISGYVKNEAGLPIENAEITFNELKSISDKSGFFRFVISSDLNKPALLQFSYGNLIREVRNYHPAMGSTIFNVTLYEHHDVIRHTMGMMLPSYNILPDSLSKLSLRFIDHIDSKTKLFLNDLASSMKSQPGLKIALMPYCKTNTSKADKFTRLVKVFLVEQTGISEERILLNKAILQKQNKSQLIIDFIVN